MKPRPKELCRVCPKCDRPWLTWDQASKVLPPEPGETMGRFAERRREMGWCDTTVYGVGCRDD